MRRPGSRGAHRRSLQKSFEAVGKVKGRNHKFKARLPHQYGYLSNRLLFLLLPLLVDLRHSTPRGHHHPTLYYRRDLARWSCSCSVVSVSSSSASTFRRNEPLADDDDVHKPDSNLCHEEALSRSTAFDGAYRSTIKNDYRILERDQDHQALCMGGTATSEG